MNNRESLDCTETERNAYQKDLLTNMRPAKIVFRTVALSLLAMGALAHAATVTGTVTNKTSNQPAAGDTVVLVDVQAGMKEAAHATTDAHGRYSLNVPGSSPYLIRVNHQGATYFIAAPQGNAAPEITVYDAAAEVEGVGISADVIECETANGLLYVNQRYFVHNTSSPPRTLNDPHGFEIILPSDAVLESAAATRPGGLATNVQLQPAKEKGHYLFVFPIQPSQDEKETLFDVRYHLPYSSGKYSFSTKEPMPADNVAVLLPKSMSFTAGAGTVFKQVEEDPGVLTSIAKNALPGKTIEFTVSGSGSMPRENQGTNSQQSATDNGSQSASPSGQAGGGIGAPINTPDPLSKYKWWILGALALVLAAVAAFLLRKPMATATASVTSDPGVGNAAALGASAQPANRNAALLNVLKEELFSLESEKLSGTIAPEEYAQLKSALEVVLKRALKRSS
jgi:hypothetical protein